jgi:hypothetical protein
MNFDHGVADALIAKCDAAYEKLSAQVVQRGTAFGDALDQFSGTYSGLFAENHEAQKRARVALFRAVEALAEGVKLVKRQADTARDEMNLAQDRARADLKEIEFLEFQESEPGLYQAASLDAQRTLRYSFSDWLRDKTSPPRVAVDPIPQEVRGWMLGVGGGGTSSAIPDALTRAATVFRAQDMEARTVCDSVVVALGTFRDVCTWTRRGMDGDSALKDGFTRFFADNDEDAGYLVKIADAFRNAGEGTDLPGGAQKLSTDGLVLALVPASRSGEALMNFLSTATPEQIRAQAKVPGWDEALQSVPAERIAVWWDGLQGPDQVIKLNQNVEFTVTTLQAELLGSAPRVFGSLDGVPALSRVYANKLAVSSDIEAAEKELTWLQEFSRASPLGSQYPDRQEFLKSEISYLKKVESGGVQLYLYDRDKSRIVEMVGVPDENTERTITYIPGTFTNLKSFYDGGPQQISNEIAKKAPNTVAFVYKDGQFAGEDSYDGGTDFFRLAEANDPETGLEAGQQLAGFQRGMQSDPLFQGAEQIGFGHSWGYQNLSSSEIFGAKWDKSTSLSGAGMHEKWVPDEDTEYTNLVYERDALLWAQRKGLVWGGRIPSAHEAFTNNFYARPAGEGDPVDDHSEIQRADPGNQDNREARNDMYKWVIK